MVNGKHVQPYLLGDSTYPMRRGLMKCFPSKRMGTLQISLFHRRWRVRKVRIENAFGI